MLSSEQISLLTNIEDPQALTDVALINNLCDEKVSLYGLMDNEILGFAITCNFFYRALMDIVDDAFYDSKLIPCLTARMPDHSFLEAVEPEAAVEGKTVALSQRMLSTDKAYAMEEVNAWISRLKKAYVAVGKSFDQARLRITPKLDGFASLDNGATLCTRGDGRSGTDITRAMDRGLKVVNGASRGLGPGEIVVEIDYFNTYLSDGFENTRNFMSSVIKEHELSQIVQNAVNAGAVVFYPFSELPHWTGKFSEFYEDPMGKMDLVWDLVPYDVDGVVLEITDESIKAAMGANKKFHRWQLAFKKNADDIETVCKGVIAQTSRTGRVNPVAAITPTRVGTVTINRATCHHYQAVQEKGIGKGAKIAVVRNGDVIPGITRIITPVQPEIPTQCPSCGSELVWDKPYLQCKNSANCPAQAETAIIHFFKTLGNVDGFGPASIATFYQHGIRTPLDVYKMTVSKYRSMGFSEKETENFIDELQRSRADKIEDWRFMASFGIARMNKGNCEELLKNVRLSDIFDLTGNDISNMDGFDTTAPMIVRGLKAVRPMFNQIFAYGFNLEQTILKSERRGTGSPVAGKVIVFTGSMVNGSRTDMTADAKKRGATVGSGVSSKTDILVAGGKVGQKKIDAAAKHSVEVLTEDAYLALIGD